MRERETGVKFRLTLPGTAHSQAGHIKKPSNRRDVIVIMSDTETDRDISDEEVVSLLESSIREVEDERGISETTNYVIR